MNLFESRWEDLMAVLCAGVDFPDAPDYSAKLPASISRLDDDVDSIERGSDDE